MEANTSEAIQVVRDALLEGHPVPEGALEKLTAEERTEIATLTATSRLVRATLQQPDAPAAGESDALRRAQEALSARPNNIGAPHPSLRERFARLWKGHKK